MESRVISGALHLMDDKSEELDADVFSVAKEMNWTTTSPTDLLTGWLADWLTYWLLVWTIDWLAEFAYYRKDWELTFLVLQPKYPTYN